jgi:hypothetical protein
MTLAGLQPTGSMILREMLAMVRIASCSVPATTGVPAKSVTATAVNGARLRRRMLGSFRALSRTKASLVLILAARFGSSGRTGTAPSGSDCYSLP